MWKALEYLYSVCHLSLHRVHQFHRTDSLHPLAHLVTAAMLRTAISETHGGKHTQQDRQCAYKRNTVVRSHNRCCRGKAMRMTYS
jgi:hypothetical protein